MAGSSSLEVAGNFDLEAVGSFGFLVAGLIEGNCLLGPSIIILLRCQLQHLGTKLI